MSAEAAPEVSVIVPARNEEACLADCLGSLVNQQAGVSYEIIVVDDNSSDATRAIAARFPVKVISADPLPAGWSGKCNAAWSGAKVARGRWLLFTDADTRHEANSIASGWQEAKKAKAALLSYSPKQEVRGFAERALMPVIFAELAATYRPQEVSDPNSPTAAANGQYLLIRRDAYDAVGGHAAVARAILEDVELAKRVKQAGYGMRFRLSDVVCTRMYRSFPQMWEGWTKNLALLFPEPRKLAAMRMAEFGVIVVCTGVAIGKGIQGKRGTTGVAIVLDIFFAGTFLARIRRAHFDAVSNALSLLGLPLFAILLLNSYISHKRGSVRWKGRQYAGGRERLESSNSTHPVLPKAPHGS